jgi:hypothetical protein
VTADRDGTLYTRTGARPRRRLVPVTDRHFRRPEQPVATIAIVRADDGHTYYQSDGGNFVKRRNR